MLPQSNPSFFTTSDDTELEWLLCLAAAMQAREKQTAKSADESQPSPEPKHLRGLQGFLKGLRKQQRIDAA